MANIKYIEPYYDEKSEALTMDINQRQWCISHKWINASLYWSKEMKDGVAHVSLESPKDVLQREWGKGYGGIRYCRRCKAIDCIHRFSDTRTYRIGDEISHISYSVNACSLCKRRILTSSCRVYTPSKDALNLIESVAKRLSVHWTGDPRTSMYGSMYYTDFPANVSRMLMESPDSAEQYVESVFTISVS